MDYLSAHPWLAVLPPLLAITCALVSRNVILSLSLGIVSGAVVLAQGRVLESIFCIVDALKSTLLKAGEVQWDNLYILVFLWLLGTLIYLMQQAGYMESFAAWVLKRIQSRRGGQLFMFFLGLIIFIDDYFSSLSVGSISRPLCERLGISKAKLSYILDATAAPVCILAPISSWGASIIVTLANTLQHNHIDQYSGLTLFMATIPYNFYAVLTLLLVAIVAYFGIDFSAMCVYEIEAMRHKTTIASSGQEAAPRSQNAQDILRFGAPLLVLTAVSFALFVVTGLLRSNGPGPVSFVQVMSNAQASLSLVVGGIASIFTMILSARGGSLTANIFLQALWRGWRMMQGAILILIFAWALSGMIRALHSGSYVLTVVQQYVNVPPGCLAVLLFGLACLISFATGTSWGTFLIMIPIAVELALHTDMNLLCPLVSACLGGGVFGDHCSPISSTTVLSAAAAGCKHMEHVVTQMPYSVAAAAVSGAGYVVLGITNNVYIAWGVNLLLLSLVAYILYRKNQRTGYLLPVTKDRR